MIKNHLTLNVVKFLFFVLLINLSVDFANAQVASQQVNYDVKFYFLDVSLTDTSTYIIGKTQIDIEIVYPNDSLIFDLGSQLLVKGVYIDNILVQYQHSADKLYIVSDNLQNGSRYSIRIDYEGDGNDINSNGALFNCEYVPYGKFTYSLTEPFAAKYWYPCKQVLTDKADSVYVYITIPKGLKAGSNGLLKKIVSIDAQHNQYQWESAYPTAFYLVSIAVGDYLDYTIYTDIPNSEDTLPIVNYIYNSEEFLKEQKVNIDTTRTLIKLFSTLLNPYPFSNEKYGHCLIPQGGGMEHQTMTTLGNFGFDLVAHELAHQWFGNWVTCSSWNDIWINEGFASYAEYLAHEFLGDPDGARSWIQYAQFAALISSVGSIYVPDSELDDRGRIFDYNSTYKKGASIIHMIRYELNNDTLFFNVLKEFLNRYSFRVASAKDFRLTLEELSGKSFEAFFNQWYYGEGYPIFDVEWYQANDTLYIINNQSTSTPGSVPFFDLRVQYKLVFPTGDTIVQKQVICNTDTLKVYFNKPVYEIFVDPNEYLIKKIIRVQKAQKGLSANLLPIILFPNPAKNFVTLFSRELSEPINLAFYNAIGKKIKEIKSINPYGTGIPIGDLQKGVYFVRFDSGKLSSVIRFVKI